MAVTSANLHGLPPAQTVTQAQKYFENKVSEYVDAGPSRIGEPSTIVKVEAEDYFVLRSGAIPPTQLRTVAGKAAKN